MTRKIIRYRGARITMEPDWLYTGYGRYRYTVNTAAGHFDDSSLDNVKAEVDRQIENAAIAKARGE